jgi:cell cycle checkpoint protein
MASSETKEQETASSSTAAAASDWRKHRKRPNRPSRLSWPAGGQQPVTAAANAANYSSDDKKNVSFSNPLSKQEDEEEDRKPSPVRKRPRATTKAQNNTSSASSDENTMWVDLYTPKTTKDLCIAPKKLKEVQEWIEAYEKNPATARKLLILVGSSGIGKSTMIRVLCREMGLDIREWNESIQPKSYTSSRASNNPYFQDDYLMSVEESSPLESFQEFLQQAGAGFDSLAILPSKSFRSNTLPNPSSQKAVILLEHLPNLNSYDQEGQFRQIMTQHLRRSQVPTVLIFSDVSEGKHRPADLEKIIDSRDLYRQDISTILQIHPVTKPRLKKILEAIVKDQECSVPATFWDQVHEQSKGDVRHAILTLQLEASGRSILSSNGLKSNDRDSKLSTFHALGKLMYAKRKLENGRLLMNFDPEQVMERSDMGYGGSLGFLEYHSVDFFTDIEELSDCMDYYSDATWLLDQPSEAGYHSPDTNLFPDAYVASLAGRAVAKTNTKPAPSRFRQFSAPKIFDIMRKRRHNQLLLEQLCKRLGSFHLSLPSAMGSHDAFVTDFLPSMRQILPAEVNPSIDNLYTAFQVKSAKEDPLVDNDAMLEAKRAMEIEREILKEDDIIEDDDDSFEGRAQPYKNDVREEEPAAIHSSARTLQEKNSPSSSEPSLSSVTGSKPAPSEVIVIDED